MKWFRGGLVFKAHRLVYHSTLGSGVIKKKKNPTHQGSNVCCPEHEPPETGGAEREFFIDNLLVRIHLIIEMILVDRPCAMGVLIPFFQQVVQFIYAGIVTDDCAI